MSDIALFNLNNEEDTYIFSVDEIKISAAKEELKSLAEKLRSENIKGLCAIIPMLYEASRLTNGIHIAESIQNISMEILIDIGGKRGIYIKEDALTNILKSQVLSRETEKDVVYLLDESISKDIDTMAAALASLATWYASTFFKISLLRHKKIVAVSQEELTKADLQDIYQIETLVYSKDVAGQEGATTLIYTHNPHSLAAARDAETGKIVAFVCAYPITDKFYNEINKGKFNDTAITALDLEKYDKPGLYKLYVSSVCIHPNYNKTSAFGVVYQSFTQILSDLAKEGIFITELIADTASKKGAFLCRSIGMKKHLNTDHGTVLYKLKITSNIRPKIFGKNKELKQLYKEKLNISNFLEDEPKNGTY